MMNHLSIRFLIGLSCPHDRGDIRSQDVRDAHDDRAARALAILAREYPSLGSWRGVGYWRGVQEPSLTVETIVDTTGLGDDVERARTIAGEVARALAQESVALVVAPVSFTLEGPHATV